MADTYPEGCVADSHTWHFHARLWQRYGISMKFGDYTWLVGKLEKNKFRIIDSEVYGVETVVVWLRSPNRLVCLVWHRPTRTLITALPVYMVKRRKRMAMRDHPQTVGAP